MCSYPFGGGRSLQKGGFAVKIERLNDNQIRCTLSSKDLMDRQLRLSELAYGSDKANALFRDMMAQASTECDFEAEDTPLMIEAIPVSSDCLVLLITKCSEPDELDTRFSNFTPAPADMEQPVPASCDKTYADEILNCFDHLADILGEQLSSKLLEGEETADKSIRTNIEDTEGNSASLRNLCKTYSFNSLDEVITAARVINKFYHGENTLFKDPDNGIYYLVVNLSEHTAGEFNKVCNILSEYGTVYRLSAAGIVHFEEHFDIIVRNKATQVLSKM